MQNRRPVRRPLDDARGRPQSPRREDGIRSVCLAHGRPFGDGEGIRRSDAVAGDDAAVDAGDRSEAPAHARRDARCQRIPRRSRQAARTAERLSEGLVRALGRRRRGLGPARHRQAIRRQGVERAARFHRGPVPDQRAFRERTRRRGRGRRQDPREDPVRGPAVDRCDGAVELPRAESRGPAQARRHARREPRVRNPALPRGRAEGPHLDDRRGRLRSGAATSRPAKGASSSRTRSSS